MSINSILNSARLGLSAQQAITQTITQNVTNATTDGYTRQRALTQTVSTGGVIVSNVERIRDSLLDTNFRHHAPMSSGYSTRASGLERISGIFNEPGDSGLAATLNQFWDAWSDLANSPNNAAAKSVVQQRGDQLANTLNRFSKDLDADLNSFGSALSGNVSDFNRITKQIADINRQVIAFESGGQTASSLRDTRDQLIDTLASLTSITSIEQTNGSVTVYLGGSAIVDGVSSKEITLSGSPLSGGVSLLLDGRAVRLDSSNGSIGAYQQLINSDIPKLKSELDSIAAGLVNTVNSAHRTGWTAAGELEGLSNWDIATPPTGSNIDFFNSANVTAANISLSQWVSSNPSYIASGNIQNATGDNSVALGLSQLRNSPSILRVGSTTDSLSFNEFFRDTVTRLGVATDDAQVSFTIYNSLTINAETNRASSSGVSIDEELIALTLHQQAYSAASRVVTTADSMAQTLLDMVR